jgi:very-short-patch-repair endonuclease
VDAHLKSHGWRVLRAWEHEDVSAVCDRIELCLAELDPAGGSS